MASTFASSPYKGQSQFLPAGYMEAATAPGRSIAAGIQQAGAAMGDGLSASIAGYAKRKKADAMLEGQLESKGALVLSPEGGNLAAYSARPKADEQSVKLFKEITKVMADPGSMKRNNKYALAAKMDAYMEAANAKKANERQLKEDEWKSADRKRKEELHRQQMTESAYRISSFRIDEERRRINEKKIADALKSEQHLNDIHAAVSMTGVPGTRTEETFHSSPATPMTPEEEQRFMENGGVPYSPDSQVGRYIDQQRNSQPIPKYEYRNFVNAPEQPVPLRPPDDQSPVVDDAPLVRPGEKDPEFYRDRLSAFMRAPQTLVYDHSRVWDKVSDPSSPRGFLYKPNFKRVGAMIQEFKSSGINTPELRQLEYLTNPRPAVRQAPRQVEAYRKAVTATAPVERPIMPRSVRGTREVQLTATESDAALVDMAKSTPGFSELPPRDQYAILQQQRALRAPGGPEKYIVDGHLLIKQPNGTLIELKETGGKVKTNPTEAQAKTMQFAAEMTQVSDELQFLQSGEEGYDPTGLWNSFVRSLPSFLQGDVSKAYTNMSDKWIEAVLRDRSGAAIAKGEYAAARSQFFPVAGDDAANVERKQRLRNRATQTMIFRAKGTPADEIDWSFRINLKEKRPFLSSEQGTTPDGGKVENIQMTNGQTAVLTRE